MRLGVLALAAVVCHIVPLASGRGGPDLQETGRAGNAVFYTARMDGLERDLIVVTPGRSPARRIVLVFPGYSPEGDPYDQSPPDYLSRWGLSQRSERTGSVFVVWGMKDSLYPLANGREGSRDIGLIADVLASGLFPKAGSVPLVCIGVSTGVEGAVKFLSLHTGPRPAVLIALSGTWDYAVLPRESGEWRIHRRVFGPFGRVWEEESPLRALAAAARRGPLTVHAFSEERSIFRKQLLRLAGFSGPGLTIRAWPEFGAGMGHDWTFWSDPRLVERVFGIVAGVR